MKKVKVIEKGDRVTFDFKGYIDNVAFDGGSAKNFTLVIGSRQFIEGFEEQMVGIAQGETKSLYVTFPTNYHARDFAGKKAEFVVKINSIKKPR